MNNYLTIFEKFAAPSSPYEFYKKAHLIKDGLKNYIIKIIFLPFR
jgi:hypothetical protein